MRSRFRLLTVPAHVAVRRLRRGPLAAALVAVALAAAVALVGWSSVAAALSQEENVRLRLDELPGDERAVQAVYHLRPGQSDDRRGDVAAFFAAFADVTEPPRRVTLWHAVGPADIRLVAVDSPRRDVVLTRGRLPRGCSGRVCETVVLAGGFELGQTLVLEGNARVRVVGLGAVASDALPLHSEALPDTPNVSDETLLVRALEGTLAPLARGTGTSVVTTAALDPTAVHGTSLRSLAERLRQETVAVERGRQLIETTGPFALLDELADRGEVARARLLLVAGQGAALIVAFAAFAAAARRRDNELLDEQLTTLGASRSQTALARLVEAAVPIVLGSAAALFALLAAVRLIAARRDLPAEFASTALPAETLVAVALISAGAIGLVVVAAAPRRRSRLGVGALELTAVTALAVIVWQAASSGALDAEGIEAGEHGGPVLLLLPTLAFLASGVLLLRLVPLALRLAERLARRTSFALRLAFLSAARNPTEAAAATTFLAVALGGALFALNYRATLERQADDEAHFAAGAAWRVIERAPEVGPRPGVRPPVQSVVLERLPPTVANERKLGDADVTPLRRFAAATSERPTPVLRLGARVEEVTRTGAELDVELLALPAARMADLLGWRDSFSSLARGDVAARLRPRPVTLAGPRIGDDVAAIRFWARSDAQLDRFVVFHFLRSAEQRFVQVRGGVLTSDWRPLALPVTPALRGAELVALEFPAFAIPDSAPPDEGSLQLGRFEQRRGGRWSPLPTPRGWAANAFAGSVDTREYAAGAVRRVTRFNIEGSRLALIHTDVGLPEALPAVVSPSVAAAAVDGLVTVDVGGTPIRLRVVGTSRLFPTVVGRPSDFVVLDYETLFAELNGSRPGVAPPTEAWFFQPPRAGFVDRLARPPFRAERLVGAAPLAARLSSDPLAAGARQVLVLAAAAAAALGLFGLMLAARTTLAGERLLLAEYEALGVPPSTLARSTQFRLIALSLLGVAAGFVGGLLAVRLIGALVAVGGTAERPLPPIEPVVAWRAGAAIVAGVTLAALAAAAVLAGRAMRETAARRLRA